MKKRKKMPLPKQTAKDSSVPTTQPSVDERRFIDGFRELGITSFPTYNTTADQFARQFTRCSLLKIENIVLSGSSDSSTKRFPPQK